MSSQNPEGAPALHPSITRFLEIAQAHPPGPGICEYLLWETIEGKREKPFPFYDPLSREDMNVLAQLRDELGVWPYFQDNPNGVGGQWMLAPIDGWRHHNLTYDFRQVIYEQEHQRSLRREKK